MRSAGVSSARVLCIVGVIVLGVVATAAGEPEQKIDLKILYAGDPGSARTADFTGFLREHFATVETADLAQFTARQAQGFDVVMLDHDDEFGALRPKFANDYAVPTMTVGSVGALISSTNGLKTGYE